MPGGASKEGEAHAAHHPAGASAAPALAGYEQQMRMMQDMHRRMAAAKTPEECAAVMKDHMKTMQDGMGMMGQMRGRMMDGDDRESGKAAMPMDPEMMKRRMDMMEMMMDREGIKPPATK